MIVSNMAESLVNFRGPLLRSASSAGHEVVAVAPEPDDPAISILADMGARYVSVPLVRTSVAPLPDLRYLLQLWALIGRERPDSLLAYTIKPAVFAVLAAWMRRVPVRVALVTGLGYTFGAEDMRQRLVGWVASRLYRLAGCCATEVVFQNPDDRREFVRRGLVSEAKTRVVAGSGIDLQRFTASEVPPSRAPTYLLIARLIREKGILDFVEAARLVKRRCPEVRCQLLGPFDTAPGAIAESSVRSWEEEGVVEYLGVTNDVRPVLHAASVFVLPSYYREGTPRTALEALATGRPVITTDSPGCRETVEHGVNGLLVPARDPERLANAMLHFALDPGEIRRMGHASRRLACRKFDVRTVNRDMFAALEMDVPTAEFPPPR